MTHDVRCRVQPRIIASELDFFAAQDDPINIAFFIGRRVFRPLSDRNQLLLSFRYETLLTGL